MRSGWKRVALEEVAEVRTGLALGKRDIRDPVERPYLRVANVQDGYLDLRAIKTVAVSRADVDRYSLRRHDVLLTEGGDFDKLGRGTVWRGEVEGCLHQNHIFAVRVDEQRLCPFFLAYQTASPAGKRYFVSSSKQSTNLASINSTQLKQFPVVLPPLREQHRIAEILRTWDEAIEKAERVIEAKQAALVGHMRAATRDAELGLLGSGWVRTTLGDVTDVAVRRVEWDEAATYRRITVRRACGGLSLRGDALGSEILTKDMYLVKAGDFVISRRQVIHGAWAMVRQEFDNTHVSKEYACLTARPDRLWMPYLDWLSRTQRLRHEALRCSYGVDPEKMVLNLDWLLKTPLALPATIERQRKLAELLDCAQAEITLLKKQRDAFAKQKRALMQKLLTGEWSVDMPKSREAAE